MRRILLPLAALLVSGPLFSQDVFEVHGYTRAGVGRSSNGGEQVTFYLPNTGGSPTGGPGYRLGNETDNYLELAFDVRAYEKGSTSFKLHFRPSFRQYYAARDASVDAGGNVNGGMGADPTQQTYIREAWGEATGVFGKNNPFQDASAWIGRRFYQRQDLHLRDQWYWNDSGDGLGIENINVGIGKLQFAYIQHDTGNVDDSWGTGHFPGGILVDQYNRQGTTIGSYDLRLTDLSPWKGSSITVGYQYNQPTQKASVVNKDPNTGANTNPGAQASLLWTQSNVLGGDNKVFLTYGDGNTFYNWYNPEDPTSDHWWQVMEMYYIKPAAKLEVQGTLQFRRQTQGAVSDAHGWHQQDWVSVGARPVYFFTSHFSLAAEIGLDRLKFSNESTDRFLVKRTLAAQFSPQASFWSRPVLRLFVTNANWNQNANGWGAVDAGQFSGQGKTSGTTYGGQIEAWW